LTVHDFLNLPPWLMGLVEVTIVTDFMHLDIGYDAIICERLA